MSIKAYAADRTELALRVSAERRTSIASFLGAVS